MLPATKASVGEKLRTVGARRADMPKEMAASPKDRQGREGAGAASTPRFRAEVGDQLEPVV
jgi:hypothetical protein